mgnify:CR=1 FL=1
MFHPEAKGADESDHSMAPVGHQSNRLHGNFSKRHGETLPGDAHHTTCGLTPHRPEWVGAAIYIAVSARA